MNKFLEFIAAHPIAPITVFLSIIVLADIAFQVYAKIRRDQQEKLAKAFNRHSKQG